MNGKWIKHTAILLVVFSLLLNPASASSAYALSAPGLVAPSNGVTTTPTDTPPLAVPEFQWTAVSGATTYRIQVSSDIAFTTRVVDLTTPNTSYTPTTTTAIPDGVWYWRVRAETPAPAGAYSSIWSFTKQWADPANAPTLTAPADSVVLEFYDQPVFSWTPVTGAARYKFQVYSSPGGWTNPVLSPAPVTLATSYQPSLKLANGVYYWRVVPLDVGNHEGTPSEERSFTAGYNFVPTLLEPADNATPTFTPTFRWTAVRGAQFYRLQYSTDPTFNTNLNQVDTRNPSHTPVATIPNDQNYYWRVKTYSGNSISDWSPTRSFIKKWYIKPVLLTPVDLYQHVRFPIFSWTPVPGASYYKVELSQFVNFSTIYDAGNTANTFYSPANYIGSATTFYWRVTPYDGSGKAGVSSDTGSYVSYAASLAPHQVYPLYYYPPDVYSGFPGVTTNPHEDRTASFPIFIWHRVYVPPGIGTPGTVYAEAYRLEVSTDPTFTSVNWAVETENTVATPTTVNPFNPVANTDYFWRVRPLIGGSQVGEWSQIWRTRFDSTRGPQPVNGASPTLIRPTDGFEMIEATPLLEWVRLDTNSSYDVQISRNIEFTQIEVSATVSNPAFAPLQSLAQRSLGSTDFGVYYWRVRKSPSGTWTTPRRFQIAAQSRWKNTRTIGDTANRLQIGSDSSGDAVSNYDLTTLQASQSSGYWHFGFHVPASPSANVTYGLYLDLNHQDGSGAFTDARGYTVTTVTSYRPEYAIYVLQEAGAYNAAKTYLYRWNGSSWNTVQVLSNIGGQISHNAADNYVELQIPNTAIGYQDTTGSYAASLFSLPASSGTPQDSVPSDPGIPGSGPITRFANVSERMNLLAPPTNAGVDPTTYPSVLPFFWDWPVQSPWSGAIMKAYLDPQFTTEAGTYTLTSDTAYYAQTSHAWEDDFSGDNTYYWRIQPRYRDGAGCVLCLGAWSQGWRFERKGFIPQNLRTSVTFATPTFSWDMVEGAESYDLQVDDDPGFGTPAININTRATSYTNADTLGNATYYWRVRVRRYGTIINNWTASQSFVLALPLPTGLNHVPSGVVSHTPTLCWTSLISNSQGGDPVLAAWKYRVQVSKDPAFSVIFDNIDTEQSCWTPQKGYDDGQYYWRVAMIDGQNKAGNYSATQTFTKQYPTTTLVSPLSGSSQAGAPTFIWTAVAGAAKYKVDVSLVPTFSPMFDTVTTDNIHWTPTKVYSTTGTYYWRVAMVDYDNKVGPYVGATVIITDGTIPVAVYIGSSPTPVGNYGLNTGQSMRQSYNLNSGPVRITSSLTNIIAAERAIYKVNGIQTSYAEMMGLPSSQLDTTYWLPWYNNVDLDTQLRISNVSGSPATINVYIAGTLRTPTPITLASGETARPSFAGVNNGPVRVTSDQNIVVTERVIYKVNGVNTSLSELMALPNSQLDNTYWLPWYNNVDLDTQLRIANVSGSTATVNVYIGGVLRTPTPITLGVGQSTRQSFAGVNNGPVRIVSNQQIVAAERIIYKVRGVNTSFSEMMAMPNGRLDTTYWLPWYNNVGLDTQLRFANTTNSTVQVHIYMGGDEMLGSPFTLTGNGSTRQSFTGIDKGPVKIESTVPIVVSERFIYKVNGVQTSFSELMALPDGLMDSTYWMTWYNNIDLDTQLRFGVP